MTAAAPRRAQPAVQLPVQMPSAARDYISYSAIRTFQQCPRRYYFKYVAELPPEFTPGSLAFGAAIHAALELHYLRLFEGLPAPTVDELLGAYDRCLADAFVAPLRLGKGETPVSLRDLAQRMLRVFRAHPVAAPHGVLLAVEEEFRSPLLADCPPLLGRVDLIRAMPGEVQLLDFKTARQAWGKFASFEAAPQLLLYAELARPILSAYPDRGLSLQWVVLTKTRLPRVEVHSLAWDPRRSRQALLLVQQVWAAIAAGHFYPVPSAMNCASCPYSQACEKFEAA